MHPRHPSGPPAQGEVWQPEPAKHRKTKTLMRLGGYHHKENLIYPPLHLMRRSYIPARFAAAQRTLPSYIGVCHLSHTQRHVFSHHDLPNYYNSFRASRIYLQQKVSISRCDVSSPRSWTCRLASRLCASTSPLQVDIKSTHPMDHHTPVVGTVISVVVSLVSITIISSFLSGSLSLSLPAPRRFDPPSSLGLSPVTSPKGIS